MRRGFIADQSCRQLNLPSTRHPGDNLNENQRFRAIEELLRGSNNGLLTGGDIDRVAETFNCCPRQISNVWSTSRYKQQETPPPPTPITSVGACSCCTAVAVMPTTFCGDFGLILSPKVKNRGWYPGNPWQPRLCFLHFPDKIPTSFVFHLFPTPTGPLRRCTMAT